MTGGFKTDLPFDQYGFNGFSCSFFHVETGAIHPDFRTADTDFERNIRTGHVKIGFTRQFHFPAFADKCFRVFQATSGIQRHLRPIGKGNVIGKPSRDDQPVVHDLPHGRHGIVDHPIVCNPDIRFPHGRIRFPLFQVQLIAICQNQCRHNNLMIRFENTGHFRHADIFFCPSIHPQEGKHEPATQHCCHRTRYPYHATTHSQATYPTIKAHPRGLHFFIRGNLYPIQ